MEIAYEIPHFYTFPANVRELMDRVSNFPRETFPRRPIVNPSLFLSQLLQRITRIHVSWPIAIDLAAAYQKLDDSDNPKDEAQTVREIFSVTILGTVFFLTAFKFNCWILVVILSFFLALRLLSL